MAKKSSSGCPYVRPSGPPDYTFIKDNTTIEVFYKYGRPVEIFQTMDGHTQRSTLNYSDYENFENRIKKYGFTKK